MLFPLVSIPLISIFFLLYFGKNSLCANQDDSINSEVQKLQEESLQRVETLLNDKAFQDIVSGLDGKTSCSASKKCQLTPHLENHSNLVPLGIEKDGSLYIFVSFSLGERALENLTHEAKCYGATLVLRGFKEGSYKKTVQALQKIIQETGQGFVIDPELFALFSIQTVPTYILAKSFQLRAEERTQTPIHDRLQGHVSVHYVLEAFAKGGDLKEEALSLLLAKETKE